MKQEFFVTNRQRLVDALAVGVVVVDANRSVQRSNDSAFRFEQESNFWYLTGINEPDWRLMVEPTGKSWLVAPNVSSVHHVFDGSLSVEEALKISGVDGVLDNSEAVTLLRRLAKKYKTAYTLGPHPHRKHFGFIENPAPARLRNQLKKLFQNVEDFRPTISKLRAIKQPFEIEAIQTAIDLTIDGFDLVRDKIQSGEVRTEYHVEAEFSYLFTKSGNYRHAYDPIIAGGKNACTLHYNKNSDELSDGLLLMDVGVRVNGYAADITRTFVVGTTTERQAQIHNAVQVAHQKIIALLRPELAVKTYLEKVDEIMKQALGSVGLLESDSDYRRYFPHAISHGLGVDVHDSLGAPESFQENMVLTVEPGIYIPEESIGVRIEDDILITADGHRNLSHNLSTSL